MGQTEESEAVTAVVTTILRGELDREIVERLFDVAGEFLRRGALQRG